MNDPVDIAMPGERRSRARTAAGLLTAALLVAGGWAAAAGDRGPDLSVSTGDQTEATASSDDVPDEASAPVDAAVSSTTSSSMPSTVTTGAPVTTSTLVRRITNPPSVPTSQPTTTTSAKPAPAGAATPTVSGLYVVHADTGALRRLATGRLYDPAWSPDGSRIAFVRDQQLITVSSDGTGERVIASSVAPSRPAWSPDGSQVAFIRGGAVFVVPVSGGEARQVGDGGVCAVAWSPDGNRIAFAGMATMRNVLETVRSDGTDRRVVVTTIGCDGEAVWSPDSTRIGYLDFDLGPAVVDVVTGTKTAVTTQRNMGWPMSWAPGADEVAFADYVGTTNNLSIARADGGGVRTIAGGAVAPAWSPNGHRIAFLGNRNPDRTGELLTHLYLIDPRGQGERILVADTRSTHVDAGVWAPDSARIAFSFAA